MFHDDSNGENDDDDDNDDNGDNDSDHDDGNDVKRRTTWHTHRLLDNQTQGFFSASFFTSLCIYHNICHHSQVSEHIPESTRHYNLILCMNSVSWNFC